MMILASSLSLYLSVFVDFHNNMGRSFYNIKISKLFSDFYFI